MLFFDNDLIDNDDEYRTGVIVEDEFFELVIKGAHDPVDQTRVGSYRIP